MLVVGTLLLLTAAVLDSWAGQRELVRLAHAADARAERSEQRLDALADDLRGIADTMRQSAEAQQERTAQFRADVDAIMRELGIQVDRLSSRSLQRRGDDTGVLASVPAAATPGRLLGGPLAALPDPASETSAPSTRRAPRADPPSPPRPPPSPPGPRPRRQPDVAEPATPRGPSARGATPPPQRAPPDHAGAKGKGGGRGRDKGPGHPGQGRGRDHAPGQQRSR